MHGERQLAGSTPLNVGPVRLGTSLPSWSISLIFHVVMLGVMAFGMKGCQKGMSGGNGEVLREVGIFVKQPDQTSTDEPPTQSDQAPSETLFDRSLDNTQQVSEVPETAPLRLESPTQSKPILGPGGSLPLTTAPSSSLPTTVVGSTTFNGSTAPPISSPSKSEASFLGVQAEGKTFVYVLDNSGSMSSYGAIQVAKTELLASLQNLHVEQKFQIIFYNTVAKEMTNRSRLPELFWATSRNRNYASQFIRGILPEGGTDHMPALRKALALNPDIIFFLTDADQPQLNAGQLNEIHRKCGGVTSIHCIEFGKGQEIIADNFLKRLARQNGGTYSYRDVTKFVRR